MPSLSTHVLDLYNGHPAANVTIELYIQNGTQWELIKSVVTNDDGRTDEILLSEATAGTYELIFHVADYFKALQVPQPKTPFLTTVPVRFSISANGDHYHVPLLVTPWSYQVYRGS